jgi:hypothetical protein
VAHSGDVEWVQAEPCVGAALGHHGRDPGGGVGADQPQLLAARLAEGVEAAAKRPRVMAGGGPHQPPGVVVDHHRQVPVALLVRHLIDADPPQPGQAVPAGLGVGDDAGDDAPDRRPGHPQQLTDRLLGGVDRQPGGGVVERAGMAGPMARPGHRGHHHPVLGAADPGRPGLQVGTDHAQVQRPPAPPALPLVQAGTAPATPTAAAPDSLAGRTATTSACSSWSKQTRSTTACSTPSSLAHSLADRTPFPFLRIQPSESRNRRRAAACSHIRPTRHPRIGEKSPLCQTSEPQFRGAS